MDGAFNNAEDMFMQDGDVDVDGGYASPGIMGDGAGDGASDYASPAQPELPPENPREGKLHHTPRQHHDLRHKPVGPPLDMRNGMVLSPPRASLRSSRTSAMATRGSWH